jgi:hypothetical protein
LHVKKKLGLSHQRPGSQFWEAQKQLSQEA